MSGSREGYQENVVVCVGVMIVFSLFAGKGGLSGHKHIYWNLIWQDLRGFIIFFFSFFRLPRHVLTWMEGLMYPHHSLLFGLPHPISIAPSPLLPFSLSFFLSFCGLRTLLWMTSTCTHTNK